MASDVVIVPATAEHAVMLAATMRPKDVLELAALGQSPPDGLRLALKASESAWSLLSGGAVVAMFGVHRIQTDVILGGHSMGHLWFLTGAGLERLALLAVRAAKSYIGAMLEQFDVLVNIIDGRYTEALRFAALLGATFYSPVMVGQVPFIPFGIRRLSWAG